MLRFLFLEVILPLLVFSLLRAVIRSVFPGSRPSSTPQTTTKQAPSVRAGGELKKDPVCGVYVSTSASFTSTVHGQLVHFCSKECRDKYRAA